jgi:DNA-binding NarL/FixJ family response regulator
MSSAPVVAILNSNDDVVEMLRIALEQAGFVVVSGHLDKIRRGEQRLADFVDEHNPAVIIYDLVPPYDRSWQFLEHLRESPSLRGRRFVVTSTNVQRTKEAIGDAEYVYEIVGKPYDINQIVRAVQGASEGQDRRLPPDARNV